MLMHAEESVMGMVSFVWFISWIGGIVVCQLCVLGLWLGFDFRDWGTPLFDSSMGASNSNCEGHEFVMISEMGSVISYLVIDQVCRSPISIGHDCDKYYHSPSCITRNNQCWTRNNITWNYKCWDLIVNVRTHYKTTTKITKCEQLSF